MDFNYAASISAAGMEVERTRLDVAALNLANTHTSRTLAGGPFKPLSVVTSMQASFSNAMSGASRYAFQLPKSIVAESNVMPRLVYEPSHPDANQKGFVAYPGIDSVGEMVNVMTAVRTYEANVVAMNAAKTMALKALEIGSGG